MSFTTMRGIEYICELLIFSMFFDVEMKVKFIMINLSSILSELCQRNIFTVYAILTEPHHEKTNNVVSEQVGHKSSCISTEGS